MTIGELIKNKDYDYVSYRLTLFDGDSIDLDICCDCFDKLMDKFIPMCKINPITEMN